jgi:hypothetical protein
MENILGQVSEILKQSWFTDDGDKDPHRVAFSTRANGDVGSEEAGAEDIREAKRLAKIIRQQFPQLNVEVDTCDEWTGIYVNDLAKHYSSKVLAGELTRLGYSIKCEMSGTETIVIFHIKEVVCALVSVMGKELVLCYDTRSWFCPLYQSKQKITVGLLENLAGVISQLS